MRRQPANLMVAGMLLGFVFIPGTEVVQAGPPLTTGLEGYWKFDNNSDDSSGHGRNLTLNGLSYATGLLGQGLNFPRDSDKYAIRPADDDVFDFGSGNFTVQVWANFNDVSHPEQVLIEKFNGHAGPGWTLPELSGDNFHFYMDPSYNMTAHVQSLPTNTWHQLVVRRDGTSVDLFYDNGIIGQMSVPAAYAIPNTSRPLLLGRRNSGDHVAGDFKPMDGQLDEIAIWTRALGDPDIDWLYNNGAGHDIPEPATLALLGLGACLPLRRRRR